MVQKTEISSNKTNLILILIVSGFLAVVSSKFVINPEKFISILFRNPEFIRIVGIVNSILWSICFTYLSIKLFDKKPGLILDENGINDNSNAVSVGLILWKDILLIRTIEIKSTKYLIIEVDNADKYLNNSNKLKRIILKANIKKYGTPIIIGSSLLKYNFEKLEKLIKKEFDNYKESRTANSRL